MSEVGNQIFGNKKPDSGESGFKNIYDRVVWAWGNLCSIFSSSPVSVK